MSSSRKTEHGTDHNTFSVAGMLRDVEEVDVNHDQEYASQEQEVNENDEMEENEDDKENGTENHDQPQPRRSTRTTTKPAYLDDYILVAEIECERLLMIINDEPWDFNEAKGIKVWVDACEDEILSTEKNDTWELVDLPLGIKPIGLKWVFKIKRNADGSISKYKA